MQNNVLQAYLRILNVAGAGKPGECRPILLRCKSSLQVFLAGKADLLRMAKLDSP